MTTVYLAWGETGHATLAKHAEDGQVDLLVAFPEIKKFEKRRAEYNIRRLCLDSGAFGAWNSGKKVTLEDYSAACRSFQCDEIFGLDVVRDPEGTRRNLEAQWEAGIDAIPTFHGGSEWKYLDWAAQRPKIAISSRLNGKAQWAKEIFRRIHPKRVHGFAFCSHYMLNSVPFDTVDATTWFLSPQGYGRWKGYKAKRRLVVLSARGSFDYWGEVKEYQRRGRYYEARWRDALKEIRGA